MAPWRSSRAFLILIVLAAPPAVTGQPPRASDDGPPAKQATRTDLYGDPLPPRAIARLGTVRWRHGNYVSSVAFSPDGQVLAAVGGDRVLRLREVATGKERHRTTIKGEGVLRLAFAPDGKTVAVAGEGTVPLLVDAVTGHVLGQLAGDHGEACVLAFSPDSKMLAIADDDEHVHLWDVTTRKPVRRIQGMQFPVKAVAFSPDGATLALGDGGTVRFVDPATGRFLRRLRPHQGNVTALAFSADGTTLASGADEDATIRLWDAATGAERRRFLHPRTASTMHDARRNNIHFADVAATSVAFAPDGKTVVSSGRGDRFLRLWDAATGAELRRFAGPLSGVAPLALSPDGKVLAAGSEYSAVRLWDVATGSRLDPSGAHEHRIITVAFSPDASRLISVCRDGTVRGWDTASRRQLYQIGREEDEDRPSRLAVAAEGAIMATGRGDDETIVVWDLRAGKELRRLTGTQPGVFALALSGDGKLLMALGRDTAAVWDTSAGRLLHVLGEKRRLRTGVSVAISPDGKLVALPERPQGFSLWDTATGAFLRPLDFQEPQDGNIFRIVFAPDAKSFAVAAAAGNSTVSLCAAATGRRLFLLEKQGLRSPDGMLIWDSVAYSADGRMLATIGQDHVLHVWEVATGREICRFQGHEGWPCALAFSDDGRTLASGSLDSTVLLWDITGLSPDGRLPRRSLAPDEFPRLWNNLASAEAGPAHEAQWRLAAAGEQAVAFLKERLRPTPAAAPDRLARLIADLDSTRFAVREQATRELEELAERAEAALRKVLAGEPSLEARGRIEQVLTKGEERPLSGDRLRDLRALAVLEHVGTPEARQVTKALAQGVAEARLTQAARAALERGARRSGRIP